MLHPPTGSRSRNIRPLRLSRPLLLAVGLITMALAWSGSAGPAQAQLFAPTNGAGAHLATNLNMFSNTQIPNSSTADAIARTHDLIIAGSAQQLNGYAPRMRQDNPRLTILAYNVGMLSPFSGYPASWYLHDRHGSRIRTVIGNQFLMDPRATTAYRTGGHTYAGWTDVVRHRCADAVHSSNVFDSCWLDVLGTAPLWSGYNVGGVVPATSSGAAWTPSAWLSMTGALAAAVQKYLGQPVMGNGLGGGSSYYGGNRALLKYVKGGSAEAWLRNGKATTAWYPSVDQWKQNITMLSDANSAGHPVEVTVKTWGSGTSAQKRQWREYAYASYLLGNAGQTYFQFSTDHSLKPWADTSPMESLPLGSPTSTSSLTGAAWNGIYRRTFSNGLVLVNPSTSRKTVSLAQTYHDAWGATYTKVTMAPTSGLVLSR